MKQHEVLAYEKPRLMRHGSVEQMTHGNSQGARLDADFRSGTPLTELTFGDFS